MVARTKGRFLARDIFDAPDDDKRYEVINGELFVSPAPVVGHQRVISGLLWHLLPWVYGQDLGEVYTAPIGVVLDDENGLQPDLIYVSRDRAEIIKRREVAGAPDLVVEVLSPRTRARDQGIKKRRYEAAGVPHYWIADPRTRRLLPYRLADQGYELVGTYGPGDVFRPELFPGLEIPIDDLWG